MLETHRVLRGLENGVGLEIRNGLGTRRRFPAETGRPFTIKTSESYYIISQAFAEGGRN